MKILSLLLLLFSCFPYISVIPIPTDTQPYALICSCIIFLSSFKKVIWNRDLHQLLIVCIIAFCLYVFSGLTFNALRSFLSYFSLFMITYASYYVFSLNSGFNLNLYKLIVYVWFIVGTIQVFIYPDFLTFLLPRGFSEALSDSGRGVLGLAPEPTHYGLTCVLLMLIGYINWKWDSRVRNMYYLLLIQIFLYSISSMTIFLIVFALLSYYAYGLFHSKKFLITFFILMIIVPVIVMIVSYYMEIMQDYRVGKLIALLIENPGLFVVLDESVNERFLHIYIPLRGFFENFFLPHGFGMFESYFDQFLRNDDSELISSYIYNKDSVDKIQSAWGAAFFELGFFAFLIVIVFKSITSIYEKRVKFVISVILAGVFLNAFPFSTPLASLILGNMMFIRSVKET